VKRRGLIITACAVVAVLVLIAIGAYVASRQRVARRRVFRAAPAETQP
jgi:Tfp pilus assembly protein PilE